MAKFNQLDPQNKFLTFDLETRGFEASSVGNFDLEKFVEATRNGQDFSNTRYFKAHSRSSIVQVYGKGLYDQNRGYVRPPSVGDLYHMPSGDAEVYSGWAKFHYDSGLVDRYEQAMTSYSGKMESEYAAVSTFYERLAKQVREAPGKAVLSGWNVGYDVTMMESALYRYKDLEQYRGFIGKAVHEKQLHFLNGQDLLYEAAGHFRQGGVDFTKGGWKLENVATQFGFDWTKQAAHDAVADVEATEFVIGKLLDYKRNYAKGLGHEESLRAAGILKEGQTAGNLWERLSVAEGRTAFAQRAAEAVRRIDKPATAAVAEDLEQATNWFGRLTPGAKVGFAVTAVATAAATALAFSRREDRQTQITGLKDKGMAQHIRHALTDFGSGWRGLQPPQAFRPDDEPRNAYSPSLRFLGASAVFGGLYGGHHLALSASDSYARGLYKFARTLEDKSPQHMFRTFGLSDYFSSYVTPDTFKVGRRHLFRGSMLNEQGEFLQRLTGLSTEELERMTASVGGKESFMEWRRVGKSGYHELVGHSDVQVRWAQRGRTTASSYRYKSPLGPSFMGEREPARGVIGRAKSFYRHVSGSQRPPLKYRSWGVAVDGLDESIQPLYGRRLYDGVDATGWFKQGLKNFRDTSGRFMFNMFERPQRLLAQVGMGLEQGSYNKVFHIPGFGEGGLVNQLLTKRALPVAVGLAGLGYLDYKTGHRVSNALLDIPLKMRVAHAEATDRTPGARRVTDWYEKMVPGPQYGPIALPLAGLAAGGAYHYWQVMAGKKFVATAQQESIGVSKMVREAFNTTKHVPREIHFARAAGRGMLIGAALMLPFIPGMLGDRKTAQERRDIYSGKTPVAIRSGRWWDLGTTPFEGGRIKYYRPHWSVLRKARAEDRSLYGSEEQKWAHNPFLHPMRFLKDPYWLEREHYQDRPYPVTSPAFSNVPLVGPILAGTVGKLVKPVRRMHEGEWEDDNYQLYSSRLEPKHGTGLAPAKATEEFGFREVLSKTWAQGAEFTGLPGFIANSAKNAIFPDFDKGQDVKLEGSRQMTSTSRRYYEREIGALSGGPGSEGYSEPLRRFIQHEKGINQVNEIPNQMPSWLPRGDDYFIDFSKGDPYTAVPEGFARLPGAGYAALHPEVEGVDPEQYDTWHRFNILADVAPYSKNFQMYRSKMEREAKYNPLMLAEVQKVSKRVDEQKASGARFQKRRFSDDVEEFEGTVKRASLAGVELEELPGRTITYSSLGLKMADVVAARTGASNEDLASLRDKQESFLTDRLGEGTKVTLFAKKGDREHQKQFGAVIEAGGANINREMVEAGLAAETGDGGPEAQMMHGRAARLFGKYAEAMSFSGDESMLNPLRYVPTPYHTKYWQNKTALSKYESDEVYGTRMRRWHRPIHDLVETYVRGTARRFTNQVILSDTAAKRRELNSMTDMLEFLRGAQGYTNQSRRTAIGANQFAAPSYLASTLPDREGTYFKEFLGESDPDNRAHILKVASPEMARSLSAQWVKQDADIAQAEGRKVPELGSGGRLYTDSGLQEWKAAKSGLGYGDFIRSKEIAEFFHANKLKLPDEDSPVWDANVDYEDVKLKIIQQEGLDMHDFNIFDDRASLLWRKPWTDGMARELTSGDNRSVNELREAVEKMILTKRDKNPRVVAKQHPAQQDQGTVRIDVDEDNSEAVLKDIKKNREYYEADD